MERDLKRKLEYLERDLQISRRMQHELLELAEEMLEEIRWRRELIQEERERSRYLEEALAEAEAEAGHIEPERDVED